MPAIRGPKVIQDAWDPAKTVRQNYIALGLEHDLNPIASGGSEADLKCAADGIEVKQTMGTSHTPYEGRDASQLPVGFGRIIRDASGAVIRVELQEAEEAAQDPQPEDIDMNGPLVNEKEARVWVQDSNVGTDTTKEEDTSLSVVKGLEDMVAATRTKARHTSMGERVYLTRLVQKYGADFEGMARDRRLNVEQRTAGELKRAVTKAGVGV